MRSISRESAVYGLKLWRWLIFPSFHLPRGCPEKLELGPWTKLELEDENIIRITQTLLRIYLDSSDLHSPMNKLFPLTCKYLFAKFRSKLEAVEGGRRMARRIFSNKYFWIISPFRKIKKLKKFLLIFQQQARQQKEEHSLVNLSKVFSSPRYALVCRSPRSSMNSSELFTRRKSYFWLIILTYRIRIV